MKQSYRWTTSLTVVLCCFYGAAQTAKAQRGRGAAAGGVQTASAVGRQRFDYLGPTSAGRIAAAAGVAGKPGTYYAGAASGGIWKSTDGARTWRPVFDGQDVQAIGALAVSESDPNVVWAGTGEGWAVRDMDVLGDGVYKSTDAGETWTHMGLPKTGRIGTIAIHPTNPNIVLVCALGTTHSPQQERGVYRTEDGGKTWQQVLFVNDKTGCSGLGISHSDPNTVIVGTWQVEMYTWALFSGGQGSGVYISHDAGKTFSKINDPGLPKSPVGKIDVAIAPSDGNRMYALIQTGRDGVLGQPSEAQGSVWRSDDGGKAWRVVSWDRNLIGRAGYYIRIRVAPDDPNRLLITNSSLHASRDGGKTWGNGGGGCGDCHDIWWDPNPNMAGHYIVTGDGGMGVFGSPANPTGNTNVSLPIGQMYRVYIDDRSPYWVYSDRQDDGSMRISSTVGITVANVPSYGTPVPAGAAPPVIAAGGDDNSGATTDDAAAAAAAAGGRGGRGGRGGAGGGRAGGRGGRGGFGASAEFQQEGLVACESGHVMAIPGDPNTVWGSCYADHVGVMDMATGQRRSVSPWQHTLDSDPVNLKYRCHWSPPLAVDYFDRGTVYFGCQVIFRSRDRGQTWDVISPDLSTRDPKRVSPSGGVVQDNLGQFYGEVVFAIEPSKIQRNLIWAGTNDGKLWVTRDGGKVWSDVGKNITGLREWGTVRNVDASTFDPGTAYVQFDYHLMGHSDPYIYKTTDFGVTWKRISDGLPHGHPLDYVMSVAENPNKKGMVFAGTGHGFFYSLNDGGTWTQVKDKLPASPVDGIQLPTTAADVAVSTYGRGLWILRDIWQLEQGELGSAEDFKLYKPRDAVRVSAGGTATFPFALRAATTTPIKVEVLDSAGAVINTSQVRGQAGMNQTTWNMLYPAPARTVLRSLPPDNPHIWESGRYPDSTRTVTHWGLGGANWQPRAAPGKYTVRMTYNGKQYSQPFKILRDATVPSTNAELVASTNFQKKIVTAMNEVVDKINRIEIMRKQVEDLRTQNANNPDADKALAAVADKLYNTELDYLSRTDMHSDDKWYVEKYHLYMNLIWLLAEVGGGGGDVSGGVAYKPTNAAVQVFADRQRELAATRPRFDKLMQDIAAFNKAHDGKLPPITDHLVTQTTF